MKPTSVDQYINSAPEEVRRKMEELRKAIKEVAPDAEEKISYSMPYYGYKGRLVYFAYYKRHIGLYIPPPIIDDHNSELSEYKTSKSAVQLPLDKPLPIALIKKLIKERITWNERG